MVERSGASEQLPQSLHRMFTPGVEVVTEQLPPRKPSRKFTRTDRDRATQRFENALRISEVNRMIIAANKEPAEAAPATESPFPIVDEPYVPAALSPDREARRDEVTKQIRDRIANPPADQRRTVTPLTVPEVEFAFIDTVTNGSGFTHALRQEIRDRGIVEEAPPTAPLIQPVVKHTLFESPKPPVTFKEDHPKEPLGIRDSMKIAVGNLIAGKVK